MRHRKYIALWAANLPFLLLLAIVSPAVALNVPQPLTAARTAMELGHQEEATTLYRQFIENHPLVQSFFVRKDEHLAPSQIHNFLLAMAELTELQRLSGREEERREMLKRLEGVARSQSIDAINRYHLARIFLENGKNPEGIEALEKITSDQERYPRAEHNKVYLRASSKLLGTFDERNSTEDIVRITSNLQRSLALFGYDLRDRYNVARLLLRYGKEQEAEDIFLDVAMESDPAVLSREEFTIIQATVKLLELYQKHSDLVSSEALLQSLEKRFGDRDVAPRNQYLLALAALETGHAQPAQRFLSRLRDLAPGTEWSIKAAALLSAKEGEGGH